MRPHHLLFVCTGNVCRSPMAHIIAEHLAQRSGLAAEVRSASTLGLDGRPADPKMVAVANEIGLDLDPHRATPLSAELIDWADHILVMETQHVATVTGLVPSAHDKTHLLGQFVGKTEIADPIGSWTKIPFRKTRDVLLRATERFLLDLDVDGTNAP